VDRVPLPAGVLRALTGRDDATPVARTDEPVRISSGVATGGVWRVRGTASTGGGEVPFRLIVKALTPPAPGPRAAAANDKRHWAYWRREALAYGSDLLPAGPLRPPRCLGIDQEPHRILLYLAEAPGGMPDLDGLVRAARHLGAWQGGYLHGYLGGGVPPSDWLAGHQLAQRIADSDAAGGLDWEAVALDPALRRRLAAAWAHRHRLLAALADVPATLCHGDFHAWNLFADTDGDGFLVIDWSNLGVAPLGADLAHLALSDPGPGSERLYGSYLDGLAASGWSGGTAAVRLGYAVTAGLTGVSRTHWTLSREPDAAVRGYAEWSLARVAEARSEVG
jgi:hypothetical protein